MYHVLQVYTNFSFFDNFLFDVYKRRSIVVAETSLPSQSFGLEQVSETSRRRLSPRKHI